MLDLTSWTERWKNAVLDEFGPERVRFLGIQGSRARGEARENSDIDAVVILDRFDAADAERYRRCVSDLPERDKLCGFVSGEAELAAWPHSELYQFCLDTEPVLGSLEQYAASVTERDVLESARVGLGAVYHAGVHNLIHARDEAALAELCKAAFFALRAVHRVKTGETLRTRAELAAARPEDADIICGELKGTFEERSTRLIRWSSELLRRLAACG